MSYLYIAHHGIEGMHWGVRNGPPYPLSRTDKGKRAKFKMAVQAVKDNMTNEYGPITKQPVNVNEVKDRGGLNSAEVNICVSLANDLYKKASQMEPQTTADVAAAVASCGGKMYGLEYRLKQPTSLAAKIGSDAKDNSTGFKESAKSIKDAVRYTAILSEKDFVNSYNTIKQNLFDKGYNEIRCKNYFQEYANGKAMHKAVQSIYEDKHGNVFEFQFQTPASQAAKELKIPIYEERRKLGNTDARNAELEQQMRDLAEQVSNPKNIMSIKSYK